MLLDICEDKRVFGLGHCTVVLTRDPVGGPAGRSAVRKGMGAGGFSIYKRTGSWCGIIEVSLIHQ